MPETCTTLMAKAHRYLSRQTVDWPCGLLRLALADSAVQALGWQIDAAALAGDVASVKQACKTHWSVLLTYGPPPQKAVPA